MYGSGYSSPLCLSSGLGEYVIVSIEMHDAILESKLPLGTHTINLYIVMERGRQEKGRFVAHKNNLRKDITFGIVCKKCNEWFYPFPAKLPKYMY